MRFEFASAGRIVFGPGVIAELPAIAMGFGRRAFVVTGKDKIRHAETIGNLEGANLSCTLFATPGEPSVALAREGANLFRAAGCEFVIAIGGGSAMDAGKAIAALAANSGDVLDYLEVVGQGRAMASAPLPMIAVPTTAGTGSEVTRNAVLTADGVKASLRSALMLPRVALVDPEMTAGLPRVIAAATALDALTQLIEAYVCLRANPVTDAFCRDGLRAAARALPAVCAGHADAEARAAMSYASLLSGLALANSGLGAVHGIAAPVGGMFEAPHGAICAVLLPHVVAMNIRALRERAPESAALGRYREIEALSDSVPELLARAGISRLSAFGVTEGHLTDIAKKAMQAGSMKANPVVLTAQELESVVQQAL